MIFKQRLFTLLLGLLFATVLTDQASALYDPGVGRFCSRDPIGFYSGDVSAYRFILSRALTLRDPQGYSAIDFEDEAGRKCDSTKTCIVGICAYCGDKSVVQQILEGTPIGRVQTGHTAVCWNCNKNYPGPNLPDIDPFKTFPRDMPNRHCSGLYPQGGGFLGGLPGEMHDDSDFVGRWLRGDLYCKKWTVCPETLALILAPALDELPEYNVTGSTDGGIKPMPQGGCENCTTFACKQICAGGLKFPILAEPYNVCKHPLCDVRPFVP